MDPLLTSFGLLIFRLIFGISLVPHGIAKIKNYTQTKSWMKQINLPGILTDLSILIEVLGGILVILGILNFIVAIILIIFFLGTTILSVSKLKKPVATGNAPGLDLDLLYLAGSILLLFSGPGDFAIYAGPQLSTFIQI